MAAKPSAEATDGDVPELPRNKAVLGPWLQLLCSGRAASSRKLELGEANIVAKPALGTQP